jgi:hypothetical protein
MWLVLQVNNNALAAVVSRSGANVALEIDRYRVPQCQF